MLSIIISSCEKKDDSIIDPSYKSPLISNPYMSKDTVFTTSGAPVINFNASVFVDENGGGTIQSVTCKIYSPGNLLVGTFSMHDDGVAPDSTAGDGRYSCTVNVTNIQCLLIGSYSIQYIAQNVAGLNSNQINSAVSVFITNNQPPILSALYSPDSILVPSTGINIATLSIFAADSNGYCDIKNVFFKSYRPDGTPNPNNPFTMYDDGNILVHGDSVAGDGRFSLTIQIPATQTTFGYFKFVYQAEDNSNALSLPVIDSINVIPPVKK